MSSPASSPPPAVEVVATAATAVATTPYAGQAILVCDWEFTGHGRDHAVNRLIAGAMVVLELDRLDATPLVVRDAEHLHALVPEENRFRAYVRDASALDEMFQRVQTGATGPIWDELPGREFWLADANRAMLEKALNRMLASDLDPAAFTLRASAWFDRMVAKYPNLLLVSDTSNSDWPWFDHYRSVYAGLRTVNYGTGGGFVSPMDATSYYAGLTRQCGTLEAWDAFNSGRALTDAGFALPDTSAVVDAQSHDPLDDALRIALRFGAVAVQVRAKCATTTTTTTTTPLQASPAKE
jgi:hypothetical protein